jgi:ornithine cyclodeaminase/alanine dehydrogenase-like protein (mu-crystallin family)
MAASDRGLGVAGASSVATPEGDVRRVHFRRRERRAGSVIEADHLGRLRTGAASGVAAPPRAHGSRDAQVLGCGHQARQVACIRAAVPTISASSRTAELASAWPNSANGSARRGESPRRGVAGRRRHDHDVRIPCSGGVARPGALVCAAGTNVVSKRELDNAVLERATFV